ncbi:MAG TPA: sugar transferase [Candidatus Limnocylindria bacterium]|nr:sugar transferase [Candidatus Limnocylindria bacterium]
MALKVAARERPWLLARSSGAPDLLGALPAAIVGVAVAVDALLVLDAFTLSYTFRSIFPASFTPAFIPESPVWMVLIVAVLSVVLLASRGLYDLEHPLPWLSRLYAIVSSISIALVGAVVLSLFLGEPFARPWSAAGSAFAVAAVAIWHAGIGRGHAAVCRALVPPRRAIVVGANPAGQKSARELEQQGYDVVGYADDGSALSEQIDHPLLGPVSRLEDLVQSFGVDELVIALPADRWAELSRVLTRGFARQIHVKYAPDFGDLLPRRVNIHWIGTRHYLDFAPVARVSRLKRAVDVTLAVAGLVFLVPLFVAIAVAIKLDSPGPTLYGQVRVGKDGRHFRMLKFRSMRRDAERLMADLLELNEVSGPMFKIRCDPRITRVGRFIRRYSLDELPQLINVVLGDMSLVGPRPPTATEVEKYQDWELGRLRAVPGITGLWQVSGRTEIPFHEMVRLDLHYIRNWSLAMDAEILLRTIPAVFSSKGAY